MPHAAQQIADAAGAVADRVARVRRRHPLVDDHRPRRLRQRLVDAGPIRAAAPRAPAPRRTAARSRTRRAGAGARGAARMRSTKPSSVPAKSFARSRSTAASWPRTISSCRAAVRDDRVHQRRDVERVLVVEQHAGAVHRRRHGGRRVREHRHLLVERLDERHAESLVLARAQEQIRDLVVGDELLVRHVAGEVHVGVAERRRPAG